MLIKLVVCCHLPKYLNIKHLYLKHFICLSHTRPYIAHNMKICPNNQNKNGFIHSIKSSLHFKVSIEFSGNLNNRDRSVIQMPGSYYLPGEAIVDKLSAIQITSNIGLKLSSIQITIRITDHSTMGLLLTIQIPD